jgi:hypothetical protein
MDHLDHFDKIELFEELFPDADACNMGKYAHQQKDTKDIQKYNPLYGEIRREGMDSLFSGISSWAGKHGKTLDDFHSFTDCGCGIGKVVIIAFLFYKNFSTITGIELSFQRFQLAKKALLALHRHVSSSRESTSCYISCTSTQSRVSLRVGTRSVTIQHGDLFEIAPTSSQIYLCDFAFVTDSLSKESQRFLAFMKRKPAGTLFLLYEVLHECLPIESFHRANVEILEFPSVETTWGMYSFKCYHRINQDQHPRSQRKRRRQQNSRKQHNTFNHGSRRYNPYRNSGDRNRSSLE